MNQCSYLSAFSLLRGGLYWCHLAEEPQLGVGAGGVGMGRFGLSGLTAELSKWHW